MGMGIKSISSAFHLSRNTVRKYVRKYQESGLRLEQMLSMSEDKLQDLFLDGKKPQPCTLVTEIGTGRAHPRLREAPE